MRYGKIENGKLIYAPKILKISGSKEVINGSKELYENAGYKEIVYTQIPQKEGVYYTPSFSDDGEVIKQVWLEAENE